MWHARVLQRSRTNKTYGYIERKIYFKDLDYMTVGVGKSEICRSANRLETQDKVKIAVLLFWCPLRIKLDLIRFSYKENIWSAWEQTILQEGHPLF